MFKVTLYAGFRLACRSPLCRYVAWSLLAVAWFTALSGHAALAYYRAASHPSWIEANCMRSAAVGKAARLSIYDKLPRHCLPLGHSSAASGECAVVQISSSKRQCGERHASLKAALLRASLWKRDVRLCGTRKFLTKARILNAREIAVTSLQAWDRTIVHILVFASCIEIFSFSTLYPDEYSTRFINVFNRTRGTDDAATERLFSEVDTNSDGLLDQSEVQAYEDSNNLLDEWGGFIQFDENGINFIIEIHENTSMEIKRPHLKLPWCAHVNAHFPVSVRNVV